jgi:hypothetical protein
MPHKETTELQMVVTLINVAGVTVADVKKALSAELESDEFAARFKRALAGLPQARGAPEFKVTIGFEVKF